MYWNTFILANGLIFENPDNLLHRFRSIHKLVTNRENSIHLEIHLTNAVEISVMGIKNCLSREELDSSFSLEVANNSNLNWWFHWTQLSRIISYRTIRKMSKTCFVSMRSVGNNTFFWFNISSKFSVFITNELQVIWKY